jgi:hypothetical protein
VIVHVIIGILVGAVLGLRFKVPAILPAIGTAVILIFAVGLVEGDGVYSVTLTAILTVTGLQFGYLASNASEFFIRTHCSRFSRKRSIRHSITSSVRAGQSVGS